MRLLRLARLAAAVTRAQQLVAADTTDTFADAGTDVTLAWLGELQKR